MVRFPAVRARLYANVFVCRRCKHKIRANPQKVLKGLVRCRHCGGRQFRPLRRK